PPAASIRVAAQAVSRHASRNGTEAWRTWRSSVGMKGRAVVDGATKVADRMNRMPHPDPSRARLHPEYPELRRLDRRIERRGNPQPQYAPGIGRIDDAVVPQPRGGVP